MPSFAKVVQDISNVFRLQGSQAVITLRDGTTFTLKGFCGKDRFTQMTNGLNQPLVKFRCLASDWHIFVAQDRLPQKGDIVEVGNFKYAVTGPPNQAGIDEAIIYVIDLKG